MATATVQAQIGTGATVNATTGWANAETGACWNREDTLAGSTTPIPVPASTGTNYSWVKHFGLMVTANGGTTSLSNRKVFLSGTSLPAHMVIGFVGQAVASYTRSTATPTASGSDDTVLSGETAVTTSAQTWDASSAAATNSNLNGQMCNMSLGVGSGYAGAVGNAVAMPTINFQYDEA